MADSKSAALSTPAWVLAGGGHAGALMRAIDWSTTDLGPVETWPHSLHTAISICLFSHFPVLIWWGTHLVNLYNDACLPLLGARHPAAMGGRGRDCWSETWPSLGPLLEGVLNRAEAARSEDQMLSLDRHGYVEECYFTFSYSPIQDETGRPGGVFTTITETTGRLLAERRQQTLRRLAASRAGQETTALEAGRAAVDVLAANPADVPFALLYLLNDHDQEARLAAAAGIASGQASSPTRIILSNTPGEEPGSWPLARAEERGQHLLVQDLAARFDPLPAGPWPEPPRAALVLRLVPPGQDRPLGFLVAGISARRALDEDYRAFFELVAGQVTAAIATIHSPQAERQRTAAIQAGLEEAMESISDALFAVDHQWRFIYLNQRAEALAGRPRSELLGQDAWVAFPRLAQSSFYRQCLRAMRDRVPVQAVRPYLQEGRWLETHVYPVTAGLLVFVADVSRRKQVEDDRNQLLEQLAQEQARLLTLIEHIPAGVALAEASSGKLVLTNHQFEQILGRPVQTVSDLVRLDCYFPDGRTLAPDEYPLIRALKGEVLRGMEFLYARPDRERFWLQASAAPVVARNGQVVGGVMVFYDIDAQKQAMRALQQSQERFRVAQELSLDGFTILQAARDESGRIFDFIWEYANPASEIMLRQPPGELVGKRLLQVLPGNKENSELFARYVRVVETGRPHDVELHYQAEAISGWFRNMTVKLGDGVAVSFSDITARKQAEIALKESLREKEVLLREVHHRVKNNLQAVSNLLYLQASHTPDARVRSALQDSQDRIKSIALIHEKLYQTQDLAVIDFAEYVRSLAGSLIHSYRIDAGSIDLSVQVEELPMNLDTAIPLGVIINELVSNAFKHAFSYQRDRPAGQTRDQIRVELSALTSQEWQLTVSDNGIGFPEQMDPAGSLGLQLVQMLAGHMQGEVTFSRQAGSTVKVSFVPFKTN